ncbi:hypothetical protein N7478_009941 [Penicillium angulare]|uniref:uncharacterized protein n=1 Tax=Penicillium angulare TaxID=116970 RepID=UPI002542204F|nr:uncharacterized protein N7478_009941 [Penicillium angulare]KAJ5267133.1 hypothetical protein N7478_009941 [Penicillium angulare]
MSEVFRVDPRPVSMHGPGATYDKHSMKGRQNSEKDRQKGTHSDDEEKRLARPSKLSGNGVGSDEKHFYDSQNITDNKKLEPQADESWHRNDSPRTEQRKAQSTIPQ